MENDARSKLIVWSKAICFAWIFGGLIPFYLVIMGVKIFTPDEIARLGRLQDAFNCFDMPVAILLFAIYRIILFIETPPKPTTIKYDKQ